METIFGAQGLALAAGARVRVLRLASALPPPRAETSFVGADLRGRDGACAGAVSPDRTEVRFFAAPADRPYIKFFG